MPLLRMLAFTPGSPGEPRPATEPAPARRTQTVSRSPSKAATVERAAAAPVLQLSAEAAHALTPVATERPAADPVAHESSAAAPGQKLDWLDLIAGLKLGGMARMLAQHSELIGHDADRMELRVPEAHRHLLEKPYRDKLQGAVEEYFKRRVRLEFSLGEATGNTPAERADQERQTRQRDAIAAIDRDPFVRELVEDFDARVIDESIRPLEAEPTHDASPLAQAPPEAGDSR